MGWLDKLLGKEEKQEEAVPETNAAEEGQPSEKPFAGLEGVRFGRYSDNNKSHKRTQSWWTAEDLYNQKAYAASFAAFFDHLADDEEGNVVYEQDGDTFTFEIIQGSKVVKGRGDAERIVATVPLAIMEKPSNAVMRRLLDMNFSLYYSRFALEVDNTLCMIFDTQVQMASPKKMYFGLKELATKADRQDDLLLADFTSLKQIGRGHIQPLSREELDLKYTWFRKWIEDILKLVEGLNADAFAGSIAYCLMVVVYRIDFLITPEAKLLAELERISALYWEKKDELTLIERNALMKEGLTRLLDITKEEFAASVFNSKATFAVHAPGTADKMKDNIANANKNAQWHTDNKYPELALVLNEFGPLYNQWNFSVPRVLTDLTTIYMAVMHADYFNALGLQTPFYEPETKTFHKELIKKAIDDVMDKWKEKFAEMRWDHGRIRWDGLIDFGMSYTEATSNLNLETKRG